MKKTLVLLALFLFTGCQSATSPSPVEPVKSGTGMVEEQANVSVEEQTISEENDFYKITGKIPAEVLDKDQTMKNFVQTKINEKKEEWKIGGQVYNEEQKIAKDFPDRPKMQYEYNINYEKYSSVKLGTVSYVFTVYEFTGGANGNITVYTFTFGDQGLLAIDSVLDFNNEQDLALTKALAAQALKQGFDREMLETGMGLAYLKDDGKTLDKEKCKCDGFFFGSNLQNFVLTDTGISFVFSKYQIAPGSEGTPKLTLTWEEMKPYLTTNFKSKV